MAYSNVPVTDGAQVVQEIASFAATLGWSVVRNDGTNPKTVTLLVPGGIYVSLNGGNDNIYLNGHRGVDTNKAWYDQPDQYLQYDGDGNPTNDTTEKYTLTTSWLRVNPLLSVHLFGGNSPTPYLYAAIEMEPGYYRHIVIGMFEKLGAALGGTFWDVSAVYAASNASHPGYHRAPFLYNDFVSGTEINGGCDGQDSNGNPAWVKFNDYYSLVPQLAGGHWGCELMTFFKCSPIQFNGRTPLITPLVWVDSAGYRPYGTPPAFRYIEMSYFEAGDELVIGSDTWKVFPWARRKVGGRNNTLTSTSDEATDMYGLAYLKD
ncbi:hypothetical protein [Marinobacter nauticus]|uniref:Virion structural protein n=1 Tax=Marinobacter nauticus TaxID=2743 RepID=A0A833NBA6_MARNT|nr:hypothetical protein [Marinobacter nauticus]KAE8546143.1 hypothetical protein F6453_1389 [Marinobacter nauticus]